MFNDHVCSLVYVLHMSSNVCKTRVFENIHLPEHAFNVHFEKILKYNAALVVICNVRLFKGW